MSVYKVMLSEIDWKVSGFDLWMLTNFLSNDMLYGRSLKVTTRKIKKNS